MEKIDKELLIEVMEGIDMAQFWYHEPQKINDPPNTQRMTFLMPQYAGTIALAYNRRVEEKA